MFAKLGEFMVGYKKFRALAIVVLILSHNVRAETTSTFNYSTVWRIVYFQGDNQFINQRPDTAYDPSQGFIFIYEILNKYVRRMQAFDKGNQDAEMKSLGIWAQLYLVNDQTYQALFIGDHSLSDGNGWMVMADEDYLQLSRLLQERKDKKGDPFDGNKEKALSELIWKDTEGRQLEDFDTHFKIQKHNSVKTEREAEVSPPPTSTKGSAAGSQLSEDSSSIVNRKSASYAKENNENVSFDASQSSSRVNADSKNDAEQIPNEPENSPYKIWILLIMLFGVFLFWLKKKS